MPTTLSNGSICWKYKQNNLSVPGTFQSERVRARSVWYISPQNQFFRVSRYILSGCCAPYGESFHPFLLSRKVRRFLQPVLNISDAKLCIRQRKALHSPSQSFASAHAKLCLKTTLLHSLPRPWRVAHFFVRHTTGAKENGINKTKHKPICLEQREKLYGFHTRAKTKSSARHEDSYCQIICRWLWLRPSAIRWRHKPTLKAEQNEAKEVLGLCLCIDRKNSWMIKEMSN